MTWEMFMMPIPTYLIWHYLNKHQSLEAYIDSIEDVYKEDITEVVTNTERPRK